MTEDFRPRGALLLTRLLHIPNRKSKFQDTRVHVYGFGAEETGEIYFIIEKNIFSEVNSSPLNDPQNMAFDFFEKKTLKNDSKIVSALSPTIVHSLLLPLIGNPMWLPPSQQFFAHLSAFHSPLSVLSALFPRSQRFSEISISPRARMNC